MSEGKTEKKTYIDYVGSFNQRIKILTADLCKRFPEDAKIVRVKKRIALAVDTSPLFVIDLTGGYLYEYRTQIYGAADDLTKADFFLENKYDKEIKSAKSEEKTDIVKYIMPKVKDAWSQMDTKGKQVYADCVAELLDDYIEYKLLAAKAKTG